MSISESLKQSAHELVETLARLNVRVVFAESCTAGLVSASLARVPGVSQFLCGSAVTYREDTKVKWLGVAGESLEQLTAVSAQVTEQMAVGVLRSTPEATWSAAITGHLGPNAPGDLDGQIYVATARGDSGAVAIVESTSTKLLKKYREERQGEAALFTLKCLQQGLAK